MRLLRAIGWVCLIAGLMVVVRDLLLLFDVGRWVPMDMADAWSLFARARQFPEWAAIAGAIWVSPVLLSVAAVLLVLRRRPGHGRTVFRGRFG